MYVIKIVKNKNSKTKIVVPFIYCPFTLISTLIFHFQQLHFNNKILSRIAYIYDGYWHKVNKVVQKVTNIVENISLLGFFDSLTEDNLTEFS